MIGLRFFFRKEDGAGVVLRQARFSKTELGFLLQALYYAKTKETFGLRKEAYGKIYGKLWALANKGK